VRWTVILFYLPMLVVVLLRKQPNLPSQAPPVV